MAQKAQAARGMRDVVPPSGALRRRVANQILDVYAGYGFELIETPALEDLSVLLGSQAGENEKLVFKVLQRGAKLDEALAAGRELADMGMRFDLTVPLARFVANHLNDLPMPFKVAHMAPVWRAERPQKGRYREFVQCDIDIVGEPGVAAEVELCLATLDALSALGISGCTVRLNDRRLLRAMVDEAFGPVADPAPVFIALDKLDKVGADGVAAELAHYGPDKVSRLLELAGSASPRGGPDDVVAAMQTTIAAISAAGHSARFDATLVRGMGYYTGQIFEIEHPSVGYSLAGGGRYDGMTARFGAPALPMCGFSIGFERICDLVDAASLATGTRKVAVLCNEDELLQRMEQARTARTGPGLALSLVRRARNPRKQTEDLQRLGYEVVGATEFFSDGRA
ncbi:MAG TPA: ATP phosphoribosyltransferase regulatory subunit [Acidimicrobiales bacterium]|nr:ATP phosphoribosyltransferase regulatory subunit [Acidimicrobiales bacterium]